MFVCVSSRVPYLLDLIEYEVDWKNDGSNAPVVAATSAAPPAKQVSFRDAEVRCCSI